MCDRAISLAASASESSLKGNDCELTGKKWRSKEWYASSPRVDWLVAVCHSNLGDAFALSAAATDLSASPT